MVYERICAAIDVQGFQLSKKSGYGRLERFRARELAFVNDTTEKCLKVDPEIDFDNLHHVDKHTVRYTIVNVTGLELCPLLEFELKTSQLKTIIRTAYNLLATEEKNYFGICSSQLDDILTDMGIPHINMDGSALAKTPGFCANHLAMNSNRKIRCALRKAQSIWSTTQIVIAHST